jgi:hypothetical protein
MNRLQPKQSDPTSALSTERILFIETEDTNIANEKTLMKTELVFNLYVMHRINILLIELLVDNDY